MEIIEITVSPVTPPAVTVVMDPLTTDVAAAVLSVTQAGETAVEAVGTAQTDATNAVAALVTQATIDGAAAGAQAALNELAENPATYTGDPGADGWTPTLAAEADGARRVLRVTGWTGGEGAPPAVGYVGAAGLVATAAEAVDVRGAAGATGQGVTITTTTDPAVYAAATPAAYELVVLYTA